MKQVKESLKAISTGKENRGREGQKQPALLPGGGGREGEQPDGRVDGFSQHLGFWPGYEESHLRMELT
jgi:hypothetical protein